MQLLRRSRQALSGMATVVMAAPPAPERAPAESVDVSDGPHDPELNQLHGSPSMHRRLAFNVRRGTTIEQIIVAVDGARVVPTGTCALGWVWNIQGVLAFCSPILAAAGFQQGDTVLVSNYKEHPLTSRIGRL